MAPFKDLSGQRFGRLVAIKPVRKDNWGNYVWECRCDCGNVIEIPSGNLHKRNTKSCGCLSKESSAITGKKTIWEAIKRNIKHGDSGGKLYVIWKNMRRRCLNKNIREFKWYGGKGIKVCPQWLHDYPAFKAWALANGYEEGLSIDRIDSNGNYEASNCRWITRSENTIKGNRERWQKANQLRNGLTNSELIPKSRSQS